MEVEQENLFNDEVFDLDCEISEMIYEYQDLSTLVTYTCAD